MGLTLTQYLAQPGHNQSRLAATSGLAPATVSRLLAGKIGCSPLAALKIDAATGGAVRAETLVAPAVAPLLARLRTSGP